MPVSGLVITLPDHPVFVAELRKLLEADPRLSLGARFGNQLPLTLETETTEESESVFDWLSALSSVVHVDVVFVGWHQQDEREVWNLNVVNS